MSNTSLNYKRTKFACYAAYALMAAGGDLGASVSPQLMGIVIDKVAASNFAYDISTALNLSVEQIGLKAGMLVSAIFPILGTVLVSFIIIYFKKQDKENITADYK